MPPSLTRSLILPRRPRALLVAGGAALVLLAAAGILAAVWAFKARRAAAPPGEADVAEAVAPSSGIRPPPLAEDRVVLPLPAPVADVAVGGGGRYLILHLPRLRKLAVLDVNQGALVRDLAIADDDIQFAAGMDKLVVVLPTQNLIQRWSLATLERELTATLAVKGRVQAVCMGAASNGPLLVSSEPAGNNPFPRPDGGGVTLLDLFTLQPLPVQVAGNTGFGVGGRLRASADGKVFGVWRRHSFPEGLQTLVLTGGELRSAYEHASPMHVVPGPDGARVFTGIGVFPSNLKPTDADAANQPGARLFGLHGQPRDARYCIPAAHGPFYLSAPSPAAQPWGRRPGDQPAPEKAVFSAYLVGHDKPLPGLPEMEVPPVPEGADRPVPGMRAAADEGLARDKRVHLIPEARLAVLLGADDRLVLQRYDVYQALEKSDADYLFISSLPPASARKGQTYSYPLGVRSNKGGVRFLLKSGPQGMTVSERGDLTWAVPADIDESDFDVVVSVKDAAGRKVAQAFTLRVTD
jgi:hypothetical protein